MTVEFEGLVVALEYSEEVSAPKVHTAILDAFKLWEKELPSKWKAELLVMQKHRQEERLGLLYTCDFSTAYNVQVRAGFIIRVVEI